MGNLSPPSEWQKMCGFTTSSASKPQDFKQPTVQPGFPFMEFNLEPGEIVNEGEGQAFQTPLPQSEGEEQGQELHAQQPRRSPRLNKVTEGEAAVKDSQASAIGSKVLEVWYHLEAKLETKLPYHVAFETIKEWVDIEGEEHPMLAYTASADPDTMYYHEAMREPDRAEFIKAMQKNEVKSHAENGVWELLPRSSVPEGVKILPAV